jgi:hypothetical protein
MPPVADGMLREGKLKTPKRVCKPDIAAMLLARK